MLVAMITSAQNHAWPGDVPQTNAGEQVEV
jgi:hypothetical protein